MTDPLNTTASEADRRIAGVTVPVEVRIDPPHHADEFLDDEWAEEFDRRLAAWESEAPASAPAPSYEVSR